MTAGDSNDNWINGRAIRDAEYHAEYQSAALLSMLYPKSSVVYSQMAARVKWNGGKFGRFERRAQKKLALSCWRGHSKYLDK